MLTFYRKEPFTLTATYSNHSGIPYPNSEIGESFMILVKLQKIGNYENAGTGRTEAMQVSLP